MSSIRHLGNTLRTLAIAVMLSGLATCYFGAKYEIAQVSPETRARVNHVDLFGIEWEIVGLVIVASGIALTVIAVVLRAWQSPRSAPTSQR
jgi:hypothetical protein